MTSYLCAPDSKAILHHRIGAKAKIETLDYQTSIKLKDVTVSFFPAGHILGSVQVRVEHQGEVWVFSGDYKTESDKTCKAFEPVPCHTFITESTFALPIYRWAREEQVFNEMNQWWKKNQEEQRCSVIYAYSLGKAQRLLAGINELQGPIYTHSSIITMNECYLQNGISLPKTIDIQETSETNFSNALLIVPPSSPSATWFQKIGNYADAFASGWMAVRANRRTQKLDKGFTLSDHADWDSILKTIKDTQCEEVIITHGYTDILAKYLTETGMNARVF
jgi:putative mRNA 3-end processing factor